MVELGEDKVSEVDLTEMLNILYRRFNWLDQQIENEKDLRNKIKLVDILNKTALNILRVVEKSGLGTTEGIDEILKEVEGEQADLG
ncbi:MAG: hypothetical protein HA494_08240 [Thaumarchaeota archaeon]|nr:hypothetical protein [Nitrososphaerota archaeon]